MNTSGSDAPEELSLRELFEDYPLASVVTVFGVAVALGVSSRALNANGWLGRFAKRVGSKILDTHGEGLVERMMEGAVPSLLLKAGIDLLSERLRPMLNRGAEDGERSAQTNGHRGNFVN